MKCVSPTLGHDWDSMQCLGSIAVCMGHMFGGGGGGGGGLVTFE